MGCEKLFGEVLSPGEQLGWGWHAALAEAIVESGEKREWIVRVFEGCAFGECNGLGKGGGITLAGDVGENGGSEGVAALEALKQERGGIRSRHGAGDFCGEFEVRLPDVGEGAWKLQMITKSNAIGENETGIRSRRFGGVVKQQRQGFEPGRIEHFGEDGPLGVW